ncbi:chemotaxis protein CheA [Aurantiacibacter poecillastricola]|uniref:chemotaxis protein CheA n=1 Tax=Aurantiacibacter poecillastricola TaxID=3064385 RepID=UPI00273DC5BB|nr:Hpt domain-containing protein [Aurantiacibacter sp. 219JJ12-13]MDP5260053.1 Hpt domain-containing protein [Aurantiacibacter sp. 219JJ12-13]
MDELLGEFVAECHDLLENLSAEVVEWEKDPSDRARLANVFRFFHTIKGNCGFFDFPRLEKLSHAAEDVLADFRSGRRQPDKPAVDAVLATIDTIRQLIALIDAGEPLPEADDSALIAALRGEGDISAAEMAGSAPGKGEATSPRQQRTIRLPVELLDRVMSGVSDMALARNELERLLAQNAGSQQVEASVHRLSTMLDDMRDAIQRIRMQRIDTLFAGLPRLVRDLSSELGKLVMVELESGDVELDRELIEVIRDPLVHLLRNAVDHGIETPAERMAAGKREIGLLHVSARQTGSEIRIGIVDDGRGMDTAELVAKAIAKGLISGDEAKSMTEREKTALICQPGFSTASEVTAISGRGVGMDVVSANLEAIGGSLMIDTTPGAGTRMMMNVPMTLSIVPAVIARAGGQAFALPRSYIDEIVRLSDSNRRVRMGGMDFIVLDDRRVPRTSLAAILGIEQPSSGTGADQLFLIVRLVGGDIFALGVDEIVSLDELVIKPVAPLLQDTGFYVGIAQLDNGEPVMALDVSGIARAAGMIGEVKKSGRIAQTGTRTNAAEAPLSGVLFERFDASRALIPVDELQRIERLPHGAISRVGEDYKILIDGGVVPVLGLPDELPAADTIHTLLLRRDGQLLAYAIACMVDIVAYRPAADGSTGIVLVDDRPVERILPAELGPGTSPCMEGSE